MDKQVDVATMNVQFSPDITLMSIFLPHEKETRYLKHAISIGDTITRPSHRHCSEKYANPMSTGKQNVAQYPIIWEGVVDSSTTALVE